MRTDELAAAGLTEVPVRRASAVSQVLRALGQEFTDAPDVAVACGLHLRVANTALLREKAYCLAHEVYRAKGYVRSGGKSLVVANYDARPETLTLLAEDAEGRAAATVTLAYDGPEKLPCDEIFGAELDALRAQGRRLCEVTRLAIDDAHAGSKMLLVRLFNWIFLDARRVKAHDDFVIEVNPRHVNYYRRLLGFESLGQPQPCPRVQGAPAVLMRLDLAYGEAEVARAAGKGAEAGERTLYPFFVSAADEPPVLQVLRRSHRAMTRAEAHYFGLPVKMRSASLESARREALLKRKA
ncbi:MAG: hypothetical protein L6R28_24220 [Planctomycetes bacterium]|nr:hypothetical protein [Planctomycetota bacterium]